MSHWVREVSNVTLQDFSTHWLDPHELSTASQFFHSLLSTATLLLPKLQTCARSAWPVPSKGQCTQHTRALLREKSEVSNSSSAQVHCSPIHTDGLSCQPLKAPWSAGSPNIKSGNFIKKIINTMMIMMTGKLPVRDRTMGAVSSFPMGGCTSALKDQNCKITYIVLCSTITHSV